VGTESTSELSVPTLAMYTGDKKSRLANFGTLNTASIKYNINFRNNFERSISDFCVGGEHLIATTMIALPTGKTL
jgi:hypothetical protein